MAIEHIRAGDGGEFPAGKFSSGLTFCPSLFASQNPSAGPGPSKPSSKKRQVPVDLGHGGEPGRRGRNLCSSMGCGEADISLSASAYSPFPKERFACLRKLLELHTALKDIT